MLSISLIGLGLSMDAFCVSITSSLSARAFTYRNAILAALYFGAFQFLMPIAGYLITGTVSSSLSGFGPFISFFLLSFIGAKMAWGSAKDTSKNREGAAVLNHGRLLVLAVATSIDALAVGASFSFMDINIIPSCALIGVITFTVCAAGGMLGRRIPVKSEKAAEITGGLILIAMGIKILMEGLM